MLVASLLAAILGWGATAGKTKLTLSFWTDADLPWIEDTVLSFMAERPDVEVELMLLADYFNKIAVMSIAGTQPDVMYMDPAWGYSYSRNGWLEDLAPYLEKDKAVMLDRNRFVINAYSSLSTGTAIYAVPHNLNGFVLFYRKGLFDNAGLAYPDENTTFTGEFLNAAKKLTRNTSGSGEPDQWGVGNATMSAWYATMQNFIWPFGGEWILNRDETMYGDPSKVYLQEPNTLRGLEFWTGLRHEWGVTPAVAYEDLFAIGKAGLDLRGAWDMTVFLGDDYDIALPPKEVRRSPTFGAWGFAMSPNSAHKELAWELIKHFALHQKSQEFIARSGRAVPFLRAAGAAMQQPGLPAQQILRLASIDAGRVRFRFYSTFPQIEQQLGPELAALLEGRQSAQAFAAKLTPIIADLLAQDN
jgi:multiple sugar transport system substrate-binding protein